MQIEPPHRSSDANATREQARLDALARYDVLDTPPEEAFDRLSRLARRAFGVSMSTIAFIDGHRQWFKSQQGMATCETDRGPAFCNVTIEQSAPLIVTDAAADERFRDNPFVVGEPYVRFYAGIPLRSPDGHAIGTLCAIDSRPRDFSAEDRAMLTDLGALAMEVLELRRLALPARAASATQGDALSGLAKQFAHGRSVLKAGQIVFNNSRAAVRCTVRQLSPDSAVVQVISTARIPDRIALMIDADATSRLCSVSFRSEQHLALAFES